MNTPFKFINDGPRNRFAEYKTFFIAANRNLPCFQTPRSRCSYFGPTTDWWFASTVCSARTTNKNTMTPGSTASTVQLPPALPQQKTYSGPVLHSLQRPRMQQAADHPSSGTWVTFWLSRVVPRPLKHIRRVEERLPKKQNKQRRLGTKYPGIPFFTRQITEKG